MTKLDFKIAETVLSVKFFHISFFFYLSNKYPDVNLKIRFRPFDELNF